MKKFEILAEGYVVKTISEQQNEDLNKMNMQERCEWAREFFCLDMDDVTCVEINAKEIK